MYEKNEYVENDYLKLFFTCSKDNPVRIYNREGKLFDTYIVKNHLVELINPISLKIDQYVCFIYIGYESLLWI